MAWGDIATRVDAVDANSAADINQVQENIRVVGGNGVSEPTRDVETINTDVVALNVLTPLSYTTPIYGLEISNDTDTEHDINVAAGAAADSTSLLWIRLTSEMTKRIDSGWSAGDDAGGLDTGSVANTTWYYIYVIIKDSDLSVDVLISASKTSPTMPAGYTYFRRIRGAVLTDGSANIIQFYQKDDEFRFLVMVKDYDDATPGTSRVTVPVTVPPDMIGLFLYYARGSDTAYFAIGNLQETDAAATEDYCDMSLSLGCTRASIFIHVLVNGSSQIFLRTDDGTVDELHVRTKGFIDPAQS